MGRVVSFIDDHDGAHLGMNAEPTRVEVHGTQWDLYLSEVNRARLMDIIQEFAPDVRPLNHSATAQALRSTHTLKTSRKIQRHKIREWVEGLGDADLSSLPQSSIQATWNTGRIPQAILDLYYDRHPQESRLYGNNSVLSNG